MSAAAATQAKAKKTVSSKKPPSHPPFAEMITEAIVSLKERTGSSQYAITKFIEEKHKALPPTFRKLVLHNLKKSVAAGKLVKVKNSFKLAPKAPAPAKASSAPKTKAASKPKTKAASKPKAKATAAATSTAAPKKKAAAKPKAKAAGSVATKAKAKAKAKAVGAKKVVAKSVKKTPVKKPKSVKSPAKKAPAKKAKK